MQLSELQKELYKEYFSNGYEDKWRFSPNSKKIKHPAVFPEELPKRCIKLFSYKSDIILDPFLGSGTTAVVAEQLGRKWIGIEQNPKYVQLAKKRIESVLE